MRRKTIKKDNKAKYLLIEYAHSIINLVNATNAWNARDSVNMIKTNLRTLERDIKYLSDYD